MMEKKILVLGSGMVTKPYVDYLLRNHHNTLTVSQFTCDLSLQECAKLTLDTIACRTLSTALSLVANQSRATAIALDVKSEDLDSQVARHDIVISLVPFIYHAEIIRSAAKGKTHVVTTSYTSPSMRELDDLVEEAGITVLNEVGVDPGIGMLFNFVSVSILLIRLFGIKVISMPSKPSARSMREGEKYGWHF